MADSVNRIFSMSYADLIRYCDNVHGFMVRDAVPFALYGITALLTSSYKSKIDDFLVLPQDVALEAAEINATQAKNTLANELRIILRSFATRAKLALGETDGNYKRFYLKELSRLPDPNLLVFSGGVVEAATDLLTEMASSGMTQAMIDDLTDKNEDFRLAMSAQSAAIAARDNAARNRVNKANELYTLLIRYSDIGKEIWYETNEAYYNDYLIYTGSSPGTLDKPSGISFNIANMKVSWDTLENATSYIASISTDGGASYQEVYSGSDTFFVYQPTYFGTVSVLIKGHNSGGNGIASDPYIFTYFDVLPAPEGLAISLVSETTGLIRLNFEEVASATTYKIFRSVVALGAPAGEFTYITEQPGNEYVGNTTAGMRNYFHVKAGNATQLSAASAAVFMDMAVVPE